MRLGIFSLSLKFLIYLGKFSNNDFLFMQQSLLLRYHSDNGRGEELENR